MNEVQDADQVFQSLRNSKRRAAFSWEEEDVLDNWLAKSMEMSFTCDFSADGDNRCNQCM